MRPVADAARIRRFMQALGAEADAASPADFILEPELYRYPAITPAAFRRAVEQFFHP